MQVEEKDIKNNPENISDTETKEKEQVVSDAENATESEEQQQESSEGCENMKKKELKEALANQEKKLQEQEDKYLRLMAEYQNYRNRTTEEKKKIYGDAKVDCIKNLLTVVDSFERAVEAECTDASYKKGVEMTFAQLQKALEQLGVTEVEALGADFDPNVHNAIKQVDNTDYEENKVCEVYQKGYLLGDRLIRPAMVAVSV